MSYREVHEYEWILKPLLELKIIPKSKYGLYEADIEEVHDILADIRLAAQEWKKFREFGILDFEEDHRGIVVQTEASKKTLENMGATRGILDLIRLVPKVFSKRQLLNPAFTPSSSDDFMEITSEGYIEESLIPWLLASTWNKECERCGVLLEYNEEEYYEGDPICVDCYERYVEEEEEEEKEREEEGDE